MSRKFIYLSKKVNFSTAIWAFALFWAIFLFSGLSKEALAASVNDGFNPNANGVVRAFAFQEDGKMLVGGEFSSISGQARTGIVRLKTDGTLDTIFNPNPNGHVRTIAVQPDGKILAGGLFSNIGGEDRSRIARLNIDGTADDFNPDADGAVYSIALQQDGKIIVGGDFTEISGLPRSNIARINSDGTLDSDFIPPAIVDRNIYVVEVQADGKILVGGDFENFAGQGRSGIVRLNPDGSLDQDFDPGANDSVEAIVVQADGKIVLGGDFTEIGGQLRNNIARLHPDGTLDMDYDPDAGNTVFALAVQTDGKVLAGGLFTSIGGENKSMIARLNADGSADADFADTNTNTWVASIAVQPDGKILMGGGFSSVADVARNNIARLYTDGSLDKNFVPVIDDGIYTMAVQADGKILVGGWFTEIDGEERNNIARLNPDGSLDLDFNPNANDGIEVIVVQADGKILVGGYFSEISGQARNNIARLNPDGFLDIGFNPNADDFVESIAVQADGKILVGGRFKTIGGHSRNALARLNTNGTVDTAFNPNPAQPESIHPARVWSIALQADGKILVSGFFSQIADLSRYRLARLNANGTGDSTFNASVGDNSMVNTIAVQPDGMILVGGSFQEIGGQTRHRIARLNTNGTADTQFNPGASGTVNSITLQTDGKILVGGNFSLVGYVPTTTSRLYIARFNSDGTVDSFNADANGAVYSLAVQTDGKILMGGSFTTVSDQARTRIARLSADDPALQNLSVSDNGTSVSWMRAQSSPEIHNVHFYGSHDMDEWTMLGAADRVQGGWKLTGLSLPFNENRYVKAQGSVFGGGANINIESVRQYYNPLTARTLTVIKTGNGSGTVTGGDHCTLAWTDNSGVCSVQPGTEITLSGQADSGSAFTGWSDGTGSASSCAGTDSCTFSLMEDSQVSADFSLIQYSVVVSASPAVGGTVTGGGTYAHSESVTVRATPNAGYKFTNWTEGGSVVSTSATYTFTITGDRNLRANFQALPTGDLRVSIGNLEAVEAGAQWRRQGTTTWFDSGETEFNVPEGNYIIEFKTVPGWKPEGTINVIIQEGQLTFLENVMIYTRVAGAQPGVLMLLLDDE